MEHPEEKMPISSDSKKWEEIKSSLEELDKHAVEVHDKDKASFEYELIVKANECGLETEQYRKIFKSFQAKDNSSLQKTYNWFNETSLFSFGQRLAIISGVIVSIITFLPTQQIQKRTELARNKIEQDQANIEAWSIINNSRVDVDGNLIQASSGRITALQNLNNNRVQLQGLEVPEAFLLNITLEGADLYRANFQGSDLYLANFSSKPAQKNSWLCGWLGWTQLINCKSKEDLREWKTELERVNFRGAILYGTKFNDKDLQDNSFDNSGQEDNSGDEPDLDLFRADFSPFYTEISKHDSPFDIDADLKTECFSEKPTIKCTRAVNAEFIGANLKSADFTKANLKGANFTKANLECVSFRGAIFNSVNEKDPNSPDGVSPTSFEGANLRGADLRDLAVPTSGDKTRGLSPEQIKKAKNWHEALYSDIFLRKLELSSSYTPFKCPIYNQETSR